MFKHSNLVLDEGVEVDFKDGVEKAIYIETAYYADSQGRNIPSFPELSRRTQFEVTTIKRAFARLELKGYLIRDAQGKYILADLLNLSPDAKEKADFRYWLVTTYGKPLPEDIGCKVGDALLPIMTKGIERGWLVPGEIIDYIASTNPDGSQVIGQSQQYRITIQD